MACLIFGFIASWKYFARTKLVSIDKAFLATRIGRRSIPANITTFVRECRSVALLRRYYYIHIILYG